MKFQCPGCQVGYRIDDEKIPAKGTHIRCKKCDTRFFLTPGGIARAPDAPKPAAAAPQPKPEAPPPPAPTGVDLQDLEAVLESRLQEGNEEAAAGVLLEMVGRCAKGRDFAQAEACRDRMYDVTPMALNEILQAGEMIEEEKNQAMDNDHLVRWGGLYSDLSPEESATLFFSLKDVPLAKGASFYEPGRIDGHLCLVEDGKLMVVCTLPDKEEEKPVKNVGPGDLVGPEHFFSFTVSTYRLTAKEDSHIKVLDNANLDRWKTSQASLATKLQNYCDKLETVSDAVMRQNIDRRSFPRKTAVRRAVLQQLTADGQNGEQSTNVGFADVSEGGACFDAKINKPENARQLMGSAVKLSFDLVVSGEEKTVTLAGDVCAVHFHAFGDCTVHVRFRKPISEKVVELIAAENEPT